MQKVIDTIRKPRKKLSDIWRMVMNLAKEKDINKKDNQTIDDISKQNIKKEEK